MRHFLLLLFISELVRCEENNIVQFPPKRLAQQGQSIYLNTWK